jgi:hypothetical protein
VPQTIPQEIVVLVSFERVPATVQAEPSSIVVHADLSVPAPAQESGLNVGFAPFRMSTRVPAFGRLPPD